MRILWASFIPVHPISDPAAYEILARTLAEHGVYGWDADTPSAYWAVGAPALVALSFVALGESYLGVIAINILFSSLAIIYVYLSGRKFFNETSGLLGASVVAVWPNLIFFTSILASELIFIGLAAGGLFHWLLAEKRPWPHLLICALFWGAACYVRPVIVLLPVALAIGALPLGVRQVGGAALRAAVVCAAIVAIAYPWTARNERVLGESFLISSNFGANFWMGNNPQSTGYYMPLPEFVEGMTEAERDAALKEAALAHVKQEPLLFLERVARRLIGTHDRETIGVAWNAYELDKRVGKTGVVAAKLVSTGFWYAAILAALWGIVALARREGLFRSLFNPIFGGWAYFAAIHAVTVAQDRYHMPSVPFIALLAGFGLSGLVAAARRRRASETVGRSVRL